MLHLNLCQEEYFTINGNITIKVRAVEGKRAYLSIDAPREVPIVRGTLLERGGEKRPACVDAVPPRKKRPTSVSPG